MKDEKAYYRLIYDPRRRLFELAKYALFDGRPIEGADPETVGWITEEKIIELILVGKEVIARIV